MIDGTVRWEENPEDLDVRNSLAKVCRTADCTKLGLRELVSVQLAKSRQMRETRRVGLAVTRSKCKNYARDAYSWALGEAAADRAVAYHYEVAPVQSRGTWRKVEQKEQNCFGNLFQS